MDIKKSCINSDFTICMICAWFSDIIVSTIPVHAFHQAVAVTCISQSQHLTLCVKLYMFNRTRSMTFDHKNI